MTKRIIKRCFLKGAEIISIYKFLKKERRGAIALFYHGVTEKIIDKSVQNIQIPLKLFENQIKYLRKNFEIISIDYLFECISNGYKLNPGQILITFDDGYKNNLNVVAPFLKAYNVPFSIFICTNNISTGKRFPAYYLHASIFNTEHKFIDIKSINRKFDINTQEKRISANDTLLKILKTISQNGVNLIVEELINLVPHHRWLEINNIFASDEPMNWNDIQKLHNQGITIGSHCHDHAILHKNQSLEEIDYQLKTSKELIEKHLGECKYFSYPNGGINDITYHAFNRVKDSGYLLGFTAVLGEIENKSNPFILPRIGGEKDLDIFKFDLNTRLRYKDIYSKWALNFSI